MTGVWPPSGHLWRALSPTGSNRGADSSPRDTYGLIAILDAFEEARDREFEDLPPERGEFFAKRVAIWMFGSGWCEFTDPWPTPSAAVSRSAQGQARVAVPPDPHHSAVTECGRSAFAPGGACGEAACV
jgi:hypothetical protein